MRSVRPHWAENSTISWWEMFDIRRRCAGRGRRSRPRVTGIADGTPLDLVSFDVRAAAGALGEITGDNVDDELLDRIFRDFCIGK